MKRITGLICAVLILSLVTISYAAKRNVAGNSVEEIKFNGGELGITLSLRSMEWLTGEGNPLSMMEIWTGMHVFLTPQLYLAPEIMGMYVQRDTDESGSESTRTTWKAGGGLGCYYQFSVGGNVFIYTGPRAVFKYTWYKRDYDTGEEDNSDTIDATLLGIIGGRYMVSRSLGIFADFGLGFNFRNKKDRDYDSTHALTDDTTERYFSLYTYKGQVGVVFYF